MFNDYIEFQKKEMIDNLIELIKIPSVNSEAEQGKPYGKEIDRAIHFVVELAKKFGFNAKNLGTCAEIIYGGKKTKNPQKVYIAGHLDVVPAGDGWSTDPFTATIRNGKIYGRGVLDNKGPSLAVLYSLKALKALGFEPKAEIRLILGGDEERGMDDLKGYVEKKGLPDYGLTPDSCFPIVNAEFGVIFAQMNLKQIEQTGCVRLMELQGGRAFNCVPDLCRASLSVESEKINEIKASLNGIAKPAEMEYHFTKNSLYIQTKGVSAHGSTPDEGKNAVTEMIKIIAKIMEQNDSKNRYIDFAMQYLTDQTKGDSLGIACSDAQSGALSLNMGMSEYSADADSAFLTMDIRVPVTFDTKDICERLQKIAELENVAFELKKEDKSTYMPKDSPFLQKLALAYEKITDKKAEFLARKGATYAKCFESRGVAFGPVDETNPEQGGGMHGKDEYLDINAFLNIAKIYALAMYELWS